MTRNIIITISSFRKIHIIIFITIIFISKKSNKSENIILPNEFNMRINPFLNYIIELLIYLLKYFIIIHKINNIKNYI